jgi:cytochrome c oxidase subunit III
MMNQSARYFIPDPSRWPIFGSVALLCMAFGTALWINEAPWGKFVLLFGLCTLFYMMFGWFGSVAHESEGGSYNKQVDSSFRWGMSWFIFSEVMFFRAVSAVARRSRAQAAVAGFHGAMAHRRTGYRG